MHTASFNKWKQSVPELGSVLQKIEEKNTIAVGVTPFPRIIPALFLKNYTIYVVKKSADVDLLRQYAKVFCLEDKNPKLAAKVRSTGYLLRNYMFQGFLKSQRRPFRLMFHQTTPPIIQLLETQGIEWIGNKPESFEDVLLKANFLRLIKRIRLPHLEDWLISRDEFFSKSFSELYERWKRPVVVQRADFEVGGEQGTFYIRTEEDLRESKKILAKDERYNEIQISPFVKGPSVSMLGCITHKGVLTSSLQLQLIDVPEVLCGQLPTGVFLGHDWGYQSWDEYTEQTAQHITEAVGEALAQKGYMGIFGIDFMYDEEQMDIFPLECNPRFTGALPVYSLMTMANNEIPPIEFFHIVEHLGIKSDFNFDFVNEKLKEKRPVSHISLSPKGIYEMKIDLTPGVYSFSKQTHEFVYERPGAFLWDIKNDYEFLMIDSIPRFGSDVNQNVPGFFKLIFPRSIATSSSSLEPITSDIIKSLNMLLRKNQIIPEEEHK
ncbi:ATP-grasp domain-containing protein [Patescibacteria group bacterium]|nr:ATP-grasp domain-containing protein [Patescibacteria group bacterium]